jgi:hypothetical protein
MTLRVFKMRGFSRFARKELITDEALCDVIHRLERGLAYADLTGGLIKERLGARGSHRVIVAHERGRLAVFLYGFAKNERANITKKEEASLRQIAAQWLARSEADINAALAETEIEEVPYGEEAESTDG